MKVGITGGIGSGKSTVCRLFAQRGVAVYDSDAAGIKASLRGIDLLLAEGLNIKVLLLPEGDDPDSFAQSHSAAEVEDYLAAQRWISSSSRWISC